MVRLRTALIATALVSTSALATVVLALSMEELTARAPLVVHATVQRSSVGWDDSHSKIWTWTELVVKDTLKGPASATVLVKQPGGVVGEVGMEVAGVATFRPGEEVVLFLEPAPDERGAWVPVSMSASKVTLGRFARRDLSGLAFSRAGEQRLQEPKEENLDTADEFLARIRAAVKRGGK